MKQAVACYFIVAFSFFFWIGFCDLWALDDVYDNDTFFPFSINEDVVFCCTVISRKACARRLSGNLTVYCDDLTLLASRVLGYSFTHTS